MRPHFHQISMDRQSARRSPSFRTYDGAAARLVMAPGPQGGPSRSGQPAAAAHPRKLCGPRPTIDGQVHAIPHSLHGLENRVTRHDAVGDIRRILTMRIPMKTPNWTRLRHTRSSWNRRPHTRRCRVQGGPKRSMERSTWRHGRTTAFDGRSPMPDASPPTALPSTASDSGSWTPSNRCTSPSMAKTSWPSAKRAGRSSLLP
jgi:hypothetical protein